MTFTDSSNVDPLKSAKLSLTRRHFFRRGAAGIGTTALASLLSPELFAGTAEGKPAGGLPGLPHFPPKAKRVIYLRAVQFIERGLVIEEIDYKPG